MKKIILLCFFIISNFLFSQQVINLQSWNSNYKILGVNSFDSFGRSISSGDINGDGVDDLLIGAPNSDPFGRNSAGSCYIIFGDEQLSQEAKIDLSTENADVKIFGANSNDKLGYSTCIANINNDNYDDIIIASPYSDASGNESAGKVFIILGRDNFSNEYDLSNNEFNSVILGEALNDNLGFALTSAKINDDNFADIIVSAPNADYNTVINCGKTYVILGENTIQNTYDLSSGDADVTFIGEEYNDQSGEMLMVGNFNGDDFQDILIGAPKHNANGISNAGKIYLIKGKSNFTNPINLLSDSGCVASQILGSNSESFVGQSMAMGDINFDNNDDIIFSELNGSGKVNVIFGGDSIPTIIDLASFTANIEIIGPSFNSVFGEKIYSGKINSDQKDDIVIGIPNANTISGDKSGIIMILHDSLSMNAQINLNERTPDITIYANSTNDQLGSDFSFININNDSWNDFAVSAIQGGDNQGVIYNVFGDLPFISNRDPAPESIDNSVNKIISFKLSDIDDGIDTSSLEVVIGGSQYTSTSPNLSFSGNANEYDISIIPDQPFGYDQDVDVTIDCDDLAGWHLPTDVYRFFTIADVDPPFTNLWDPAPDSNKVSTNTDIIFHIYDLGEGVDLRLINVQVRGINYYSGRSGFSYSGSPNHYEITIAPENVFEYGEIVTVIIDAADQSNPPNVMESFEYTFTCIDDDVDPPFLRGIHPTPNSNNVPVNTLISFEVLDSESGIDENSIIFRVNGEILNSQTFFLDPINYDDTTGFEIQYDPEDDFQYGEFVNVQFIVEDGSSNSNELIENYSFNCEADTLAPELIEVFPKPDSLGFPNTTLYFHFRDEQSGIDSSTFILKLNNVFINSYQASYDKNSMQIIYQPAEHYNSDSLLINIQLDDFVGNHLDTTYSITILQDEYAPYILPIYPQPNSFNVNLNDTLKVDILDRGMGIEQSTIEFKINGESENNYQLLQNPYNFNPDSLGYRLCHVLDEGTFYEGQLVHITVSANDIVQPHNYVSESYSFNIFKEINEDVKAIPNILTLNDDNYNDECKIWINTSENVDDIETYIYSRNGKKIATLSTEIFSNEKKYAIWRGKDKNNKKVKSGIYIYQIIIKNRTYQGSIVVAK